MDRFLQYYENFLAWYRNLWNTGSHRRNILVLCVLYLVRFLLTLAPVSSSGDAVLKWNILRIWTTAASSRSPRRRSSG